MATHTTPKNEVCTYSYDQRDRQTLANWNTTTPDTAKTYWADGMIKSIDNGISKSDYAYNARHELTSETQTLSGRPARTVSYSYDADGLRSSLQGSAGVAPASYTWTSRFQLASVSADGPPPLATYNYDKAGRNTAIVHENGITESKSYDAANELLANTHLKNGNPVSGSAYTLDLTGRRTAETFADGTTPARSYGYDPASQVTAADYGNSLSDSYNYDPAGNRSSATLQRSAGVPPASGTITYTANNANQYTTITGLTGLTPVSHDANGNLLQQNGVTYTWDSENRLLSVTPNTPALGDKSLVHTYDGLHRRATRTVREWTAGGWNDLETTQFVYDGWNVIEEYEGSTGVPPVLVRTFTWGQDLGGSKSLQAAGGVGGLLLAEEINGTSTTAYHFHYDGNGNVTEITDLSGNNAASYRYDAFGNTLSTTGAYASSNHYRFSTKPLDSEVTNAPLYYYGYRYYDPLTGRWPSRDPIEEAGGVNLYGFVGNDGVNNIDNLGFMAMNGMPPIDYGYGPGVAPFDDYESNYDRASREQREREQSPCEESTFFRHSEDLSDVTLEVTLRSRRHPINVPRNRPLGHAPGTIFTFLEIEGPVKITMQCIHRDCKCKETAQQEKVITVNVAISIEVQQNIVFGGPLPTAIKVLQGAGKLKQLSGLLAKKAEAEAKASGFCQQINQ